jgi:hypothetical protein
MYTQFCGGNYLGNESSKVKTEIGFGNVKVELKETVYEDGRWMELTQNQVRGGLWY